MLAQYVLLLHGSMGFFDDAVYLLAGVCAVLAIACFGAEAYQRHFVKVKRD